MQQQHGTREQHLQYGLYEGDGLARPGGSEQNVRGGPALPSQDPPHSLPLRGVEQGVEEAALGGHGFARHPPASERNQRRGFTLVYFTGHVTCQAPVR